jgi:hypothetical protein
MNYILLSIFTILQIGDAVSTYYALKRPGVTEGVAFTKWLQTKIGVIGAGISISAALISLVAGLLYFSDLYGIVEVAQIFVGAVCIQRAWTVYGNWQNTK